MSPWIFPVVGGVFVIMVFCVMIGFLILEPGTKGQEEKKKKVEAIRLAKIKRIAQKSWMLETLRPELQVTSK